MLARRSRMLWFAPSAVGRTTLLLPERKSPSVLHHDPGAHLHAFVEVDHVLVHHANAPGGDCLTDGPGLVRAVDAVVARTEIHGARAERIVRAARHVGREVRAALAHRR